MVKGYMCIKVEWKIFKNIGFFNDKKTTVKLKIGFTVAFLSSLAVAVASDKWQVKEKIQLMLNFFEKY